MKQLVVLILFTLFFNYQHTFCQDSNSAGSYLAYINTQYSEISKDMMSYSSAVAHGKGAAKVEKKRKELTLQLKTSERNVRKMKPFDQKSQLRDSVASYMRICQIVLNEDYGKIINMEEIAEQSYDAMEAYLLAKEIASQKLDEASNRVETQYTDFAAANNIKLVESSSKLGDKIKMAAKVSEYHKKIYLLFFKSYKNEAYFLDGLDKKDVNAMEQTKNSLETGTNADLSKLGPIPSFDGDASLKTACQQLLTFYKKEATVLFPAIIDFYLKNEDFEKIKKAYETSRTKTKAELETYNKAVSDFNAAVDKYNKVNDECNKNRTVFLNKWNDASEKFLDNHTPKYR